MMTKINLLPPDQRKALIPLERIFTAIAIVMLSAFTFIYMYGYFETASLEKQIAIDNESYQLLRQTIERQSAIEEKNHSIDQKSDILFHLSKQNNSWYSILVHLGSIVPEKVWLEEVGMNDQHMLIIKGSAINFQSLSVFMQNFKQNTLLENPILTVSERIKVNNAEYSITSFTISANFKEQ